MILSIISAAAAGTLAPGQALDEALAIHLTKAGLARVGDGLEGLVPERFPISDIGGELVCDAADASPLSYQLDTMELLIDVQQVDIATSDGRLDLTLYLTVGSTPAELLVAGDCTLLTDLDEVCGVELPTTAATFHLGTAMELTPQGAIRTDVDDLSLWISPVGNPLSDCTLASAVGTLLGQDEGFIANLITGLVGPALDGAAPDIEEALDGALEALTIEQDISLGDAELSLELYPSELRLDDSGLLIGLGARSAVTPLSDCVPAGAGSPTRAPGWPDIGETAWGGALAYDAGLFVNGDFIDHLLWSIWASGLLCVDVGDYTADLGIDIDTEFLGTLFGEDFQALFPEAAPATLRAFSTEQPRVVFDDDIPLALDLADFGLETIAELDGRRVRINKIALADDIGLDPGIRSDAVAPELLLDLADLRFSEPVNEYTPAGYSEGLADFLPTIFDQLGLGDTTDGLLPSFSIPDFYGMGIETVFWLPDEAAQWQGGFLVLDVDEVQPLELEGCSGAGLGCGAGDSGLEGVSFEELLGCGAEGDPLGCGTEGGGCASDGGGCASDGGCGDSAACTTQGRRRIYWPGTRMMMFGFMLSVIALRRRA